MSDLIKDPVVMREILLDHYEYPRHHGLQEAPGYKKIHMASDSCIDDIYVEANIKDGVIEDINFNGHACAISTASTSIMTELVVGKTIDEARNIMDNYYAMIDGNDYDEELLDEAVCLSGVGKQANRIKCATIGWNGLKQLLENSEEESHEQ